MVRARITSPWPHVSAFKDRHGRTRWRWRKKGAATVTLPGDPGSPAFMAAIEAAEQAHAPLGLSAHPKSFRAAVASYYQSGAWRGMVETTRQTYRRTLERIAGKVGNAPLAALTAAHIRAAMNAMADRPGAANELLKAMRVVLGHAVDMGLIERNPARDVRRLKTRGRGATPWTPDDCAKFEARWPSGSTPRLAYVMLRELGQRRGDISRIGRQHMRGGSIVLRQQKTGAELILPVSRVLAAELNQVPQDRLTYLSSAYGRPYTPAGFGIRFREWCNAAGLPTKSAHGLRKTAAIELAEAGATAHEIMAITGHASLAEAERYTRGVRQEALAKSAAAKRRAKGTNG